MLDGSGLASLGLLNITTIFIAAAALWVSVVRVRALMVFENVVSFCIGS